MAHVWLSADYRRPEQVWVSDITSIRLRYGLVYLAVIMDVFTRCVRGWHLGRDLDHLRTRTALERALARHPAREIHHPDQGVQYAATTYTERLIEAGVKISMADVGQAWQNGYAERLIRGFVGRNARRSERKAMPDIWSHPMAASS